MVKAKNAAAMVPANHVTETDLCPKKLIEARGNDDDSQLVLFGS